MPKVYKGCKSNNDGVEKMIVVPTYEESSMAAFKRKGFPNCKGSYPDCPSNPSKKNRVCLLCPVNEEGV
jgi:hypothetical protein